MTTEQKQTAGVAIASLVLGILGMIMIGPLGSIPAVICGHVAKSKIKKNPDTLTGDGLALAGLILGYVQIGFMVMILPLLAAIAIPAFVKARDVAQRNACINNLRQIAAAKDEYALEYGTVTGSTVLKEENVALYIRDMGYCFCPKAKGADRCFGASYSINALTNDPTCKIEPMRKGKRSHSLFYGEFPEPSWPQRSE